MSQNCLTEGYPATIASSSSILRLNISSGRLPATIAVNGMPMHSMTVSADIVPCTFLKMIA